LAALANVPHGLKVEGAKYPVLRVFASWPGEANLERTLTWKEDNIEDPNLHPLAMLHKRNFDGIGEKLDTHWFLGDLEKKLVLHLKVPHEDVEPSRPGRRRNQGGYLEDAAECVIENHMPKTLTVAQMIAVYVFVKRTQIDRPLPFLRFVFVLGYLGLCHLSLRVIIMLSIRNLEGQGRGIIFCISSASLSMLMRIIYCPALLEADSVHLHLHCTKLVDYLRLPANGLV
jgi:hypothetical protein